MMMKKSHRHGGRVAVPIHPIVTEGPVRRDPDNVRVMLKEIRLLEERLRRQKGDITTLRELLIHNSTEEHWEVPG
jgi:hypothetical protein